MVKVKICGLTNGEDALLAAEFGADFLGFVFAPSPRQVKVEEAEEFWGDLPEGLPRVGVFKDQKAAEVAAVIDRLPLDWLQFHGQESPAVCRSFGMPVIRACSPAGVRGLNFLELYRDVAEYFLVDLPKEGSAHDVLPGEVARAAADMGKPVFLAGGLTAQNVGALLAAARPFGVDVARGVEAEPGRKDREKIRSFMTAVRASPG